jgi:hypothetical protein
MTITRILPGLVLLAAVAGPAMAQHGFSGARYTGVVPSVMPAGAEEPAIPPIPPTLPGRPPAAVRSLEQMTMPTPPGEVAPADPVGTLSAPPFAVAPGMVPGYPPGSYPSPYYTDGPGCCGPLGADGRIGYELYAYTGVNIVFGEGLPQFLNAGWMTGGGARTLFFDATHTTAWTFDLGASYTYNRGKGRDEPTFLFLRTPAVQDQFTGVLTPQPDRFVFTAIRGVHRTSFNFALGRDWWLWGAGNTGGCVERNARVGGWVGGRYGTSHVDQVPLDEIDGYSRRQNVFHGVYVGAHATFDVPMGGWIWFGGMRVEYGHDWTNLTPPLEGNIHNVNILLTAGFRY